MDRRFAADEWSGLSTEEQIRRCRLMADEAMKLSEAAPPKLKEGYVKLAEQWLTLATEMLLQARGQNDG